MKSTLVEVCPPKGNHEFLKSAFFLIFLFLTSQGFSQGDVKYDIVHIKFKEQYLPTTSARSARSGMASMDLVSEKYSAITMERIFPESMKFEKAHQAFGLHLWYQVKFPKGADTARVISEYKNLNYFQKVEACREYKAGWDRNQKVKPVPSMSSLSSGANDTYYDRQWHYNNTGQSGGTPGADISLAKAWQLETGSSNVIVAVIDGGVDINHPDLKQALWVNTGEIPGNGIDDDRNGYRDDIHGFGFGDFSSTIYPDVHGTHVAGTIGAISNNSRGVAGVAGGSGTADGVRIMSLATFGEFNNANFEQAMIYAADNGAVISQNSWGGGSTAIEAAIDYFIARAGYDNSDENFAQNIQTGPMAGGIVIFAAGNDNTFDTFFGYPASYAKVLAVASTTHNDIKAGTSNYGVWVDIAAPGASILSTVPNSQYGYLSGTSMACPHVSGVAALLISYLQQPGLKPAEIRTRLTQTTKSIDAINPNHAGLLGSGRLNAFRAFAKRDLIPPGSITDLQAKSATSSSITLEWTAPAESGTQGGPVEKYEIRRSALPITEENFNSATLIGSPSPALPGSKQTLTVNALPQGQYYFAIKSTDVFALKSSLSNVLAASTLNLGVFEASRDLVEVTLYSGQVRTEEIELRHLSFPPVSETFDLTLHPTGEFPWITFLDEHIYLAEGETKSLEITLDTESLEPGEYTGQMQMLHRNAFVMLNVQVKLTVLPPAGLGVNTSINFSSQLINEVSDSTIALVNHNAAPLTITNIQSSDNRVTVSANSATLQPGEEFPLTISVTGSEPGQVDALVTITTDDPEFETALVRVKANVIQVPVVVINPLVLDAKLTLSEKKDFHITIANSGTESLPWSIDHQSSWISVSPNQGTIPAGALQVFTVTIGSPTLSSGVHTANLKILTGDSGDKLAQIAVTATVSDQPRISLNKIHHDFGDAGIGSGRSSSLKISNTGSTPLIITTISSDNPYYTTTPSSATIPPNESIHVTMFFSPLTPGLSTGVFTFYTNDPDQPEVQLTLTGKGFISSAPEITPIPVAVTVLSGDQHIQNLEVKNMGESLLYASPGSDNNWIKRIGGELFIPGGETATVPIQIDASGKTAGVYNGTITVWYLDWVSSSDYREVPVTMTVTDAPGIRVSTQTLSFGDGYINQTYDSVILISNKGVLPLTINSIVSDNTTFSISTSAPITLAPGENVEAMISFTPTSAGPQNATFTFTSNDPNDGTYTVSASGAGLALPELEVNTTEIHQVALTNELRQQSFTISNSGGSDLTWQLALGDENALGDFALQNTTPQIGFKFALNPASGLFYGQAYRNSNLFEYNPANNQWTAVAGRATDVTSFSHMGAAFVSSSMYCFFDSKPNDLYRYNIQLKEWINIPSQLGGSPAAITSDGNELYLASGNTLKSYNPVTGIWITLPVAPFSNIGGLSYFDGTLYAHAAANTSFAAYSLSTGTWESLPAAPGEMTLESTIDTNLKRYYALSKVDNNLYEYDMNTRLWTVVHIPLFTITNGSLVYLPSAESLHFSEGELGNRFGQYTSTAGIPWLKVLPVSGKLAASSNQDIALHFSAENLNTGTYETTLTLTSNDPEQSIREIPVTLEVTNPGAIIEVTHLIEASLNRLDVYTNTLKIENKGAAPLTWNLADALPAGMTLSKISGTLAANSFENVTLTFTPPFISPRVLDYNLRFASNDNFAPEVFTRIRLTFTTPLNKAPIVMMTPDDQSVTIGTPPIEISIDGIFSDADGDPITYAIATSNSQVISPAINGTTLRMFVFNLGTSTITITGKDDLDASASTEFTVSVNEVITSVEPGLEKSLHVFPNPFNEQFTVRYTADKPLSATVMLFDTNGKTVWKSVEYREMQGDNSIAIDALNLPSGIYHCRLIRKGGEAATIRILKN